MKTNYLQPNIKKLLAIILILCFFITNTNASVNEHTKYIIRKPITGINKNGFIRIPPPAQFSKKSVSDSKLNFNVTFTGFPDSAKVAFNYALSILSSLLTSEVPVDVDAKWLKLDNKPDSDVLGAASAANFFINNEEFTQQNVFIVAPIAERMAKRSLNPPGSPDIFAYFNSQVNWYFGTDGNTPNGKYDFITVVIHEMIHGLGFQSSMEIDGNKGVWGYGSHFPFSFDRFIENDKEQLLIDRTIYPNPSVLLSEQMTSENLYFNGKALKFHTGSKAKLYSPKVFIEGSSIDHLSEEYNNTEHDLMTSGILKASSIHNPGQVTLAILEDIGWSGIGISHEPILSSEIFKEQVFKANFSTGNYSAIVSPQLNYRLNGGPWLSKQLSNTNLINEYSTSLNFFEHTKVDYYFSCEDKYGRKFNFPNTVPDKTLYFEIGPDSVLPEIKHVPNNVFFEHEKQLVLLAEATDLHGIKNVWVEYYFNGRRLTDLEMRSNTKNKFNLVINFHEIDIVTGDSILYRIAAKDNSINESVGYHPSSGYHKLKVETLPNYITTYQTSFDGGFNEFIVDGFDFTTARSFTNPALHTKHPYESAGSNSTKNTTAQLFYPIKIAETDHFMVFDQIVLVEPSINGATFGTSDFKDYVVVEASIDGENNWLPIVDGWDSNANETWLKVFDQGKYFNNSAILSDLDLYRTKHIDLTSNPAFDVGDIIEIRFRLSSDQQNIGWGWAIDNLSIQTKGLPSPILEKQKTTIFPNPSNGTITISGNENYAQMWLYNQTGGLVFEKVNLRSNEKINLPQGLKGLYILVLQGEKKTTKSKLIIVD